MRILSVAPRVAIGLGATTAGAAFGASAALSPYNPLLTRVAYLARTEDEFADLIIAHQNRWGWVDGSTPPVMRRVQRQGNIIVARGLTRELQDLQTQTGVEQLTIHTADNPLGAAEGLRHQLEVQGRNCHVFDGRVFGYPAQLFAAVVTVGQFCAEAYSVEPRLVIAAQRDARRPG